MSCFLKRVQWTRTSTPLIHTDLPDVISVTVNKSTQIQNNICTVTLKNPPVKLASDASTVIGTYVDPSNKLIMFGEEDEIEVWAKFSIDPADFESATWYNSNNRLGNFLLEEYAVETSENSCRITLKAVDSAYLLFNKVHTFTYGINNTFTASGIVRHLCRQFSEANAGSITTFPGTDNDVGTLYLTDARFVSEGGEIKDYRTEAGSPSTTLNGALASAAVTITVVSTTGFESVGTLVIGTEHVAYSGKSATQFTGCSRAIDDTTDDAHVSGVVVYQGFPAIGVTKIWKPLFEWIGEVCQTENTNYEDEYAAGGTLFYNRAFLFWIDDGNSANFFYPDDTIDLSISLGEEGRRAFRLEKSVFDAVNFVVYNCGEDMYGNGCIYYLYDETSSVKSLKMRYQPMTEIINGLVSEDIKVNSTRETTPTDVLKQFPTDASYPISSWAFKTQSNNFRSMKGDSARTTLANDSEYNDSLREAAKWEGWVRAGKITSRTSGLRYRGQIALKGVNLAPGDLVRVTDEFTGQNVQLLRVIKVTHNINNSSFESVIEVEEDEAT